MVETMDTSDGGGSSRKDMEAKGMLYVDRSLLSGAIGMLAVWGVLSNTAAQSGTPLSARDSDPVKLGWMTGFPPPPDKRIMQPESDFFSFPELRWTVCHIRELMLNGGEINGKRLFPETVVETIQNGGDKEAFAKAGYKTLPGGSYRSMWWVFHNSHGAFAARGVHGQTIYVDPTAEMVIVRLASFPTAKHAKMDPTSLPADQAVAEYLRED